MLRLVDVSHEISWSLRTFVGGSADPHFLEPAAERVGMNLQNVGCALWALDDPVRLLKDRDDVISLHGLKFQKRDGRGLVARCRLRAGENFLVNFER